MDDQDFHTLLARISEVIPERESKLTIGGATALTLFAGVLAFLCLGYFTNAGDIKSLKLQDEYFKAAITKQESATDRIEKTLTEIRMDQIRREKMEGRR